MPTDGELLLELRADVLRLEKRTVELQDEVLANVNRLHGALDESDRLRAELKAAELKCLNWDTLQTILDTLKAHASRVQ